MARYEARKRGQVDIYEVRKKRITAGDIFVYVGGTILGLLLIIGSMNS